MLGKCFKMTLLDEKINIKVQIEFENSNSRSLKNLVLIKKHNLLCYVFQNDRFHITEPVKPINQLFK